MAHRKRSARQPRKSPVLTPTSGLAALGGLDKAVRDLKQLIRMSNHPDTLVEIAKLLIVAHTIAKITKALF